MNIFRGLGFRDFGFRDLGFRVQGLGFRVLRLRRAQGFRIWGSEFRA